MQVSAKTTQTLMAVIATILVVAALQATKPISVPLAFAFFIAILVYPVQRWLERYMPRWLSLPLVMILILAVLGIGVGAIALSVEIIEPKLPGYISQLQQMAETTQNWLQSRGLPSPSIDSLSSGSSSQLTQQAIGGIQSVLSVLSWFVLVISLLVLLLLEVNQYRDKVKRAFPSRSGDRIIDAVCSTSSKLRRYLLVMTFTSFLTGILTTIWCFILGVELAFVWGLIAFVLNYVPTLGSIIAVIPPTLVALIFQGIGRGIATLLGLAAIQVTLGNFVDPRLQGNYLKLSPFIALTSIIFWGWVWGIPGAILGVPMTVAIVLMCGEFEATRGIATVLGNDSVECSSQL